MRSAYLPRMHTHTHTLALDGVLGALGLSAFRRPEAELFIGRAVDRLEMVLMVVMAVVTAAAAVVLVVAVVVVVEVDTGYELARIQV